VSLKELRAILELTDQRGTLMPNKNKQRQT